MAQVFLCYIFTILAYIKHDPMHLTKGLAIMPSLVEEVVARLAIGGGYIARHLLCLELKNDNFTMPRKMYHEATYWQEQNFHSSAVSAFNLWE